VVLVVVLGFALRPTTPRTEPPRVPDPSPPTSPPEAPRANFSFDFTPVHARVSVDGEELGAGRGGMNVPRDGRTYALRVTCEGYVPYTEVLRATGDVHISRALLPRDAGVDAVPARRTRPTRPTPAVVAPPSGRRPIDPAWPP
jgi:hypothetical protein